MEREIKFKAKSKKDCDWVSGSLVKENEKTYFIQSFLRGKQEVFKDTICQYIGVVDSNCRIIYEGDVLMMDDTNALFSVKWSERNIGFVFVEYKSVEDEKGSHIVEDYKRFTVDQINNKVRVITNVHDLCDHREYVTNHIEMLLGNIEIK